MTMYSDTVKRLKSQWQDMLNSGRMVGFEILDPTVNSQNIYHWFNLDFYQADNHLWYFKVCDDYGRYLFGMAADSYFDDISHYMESLYNRCFEECCK